MKRPKYVLDSYAMIAHFLAQPGGDRVRDLLRQAQQETLDMYMSWINLGETAYIVERRRGEAAVQELISDISRLPITLVEAEPPRVLAAARVKARHPLSYADAFAVALAQELDAPLVTGDPEFHKVEEIVQVLWL